MALDFSRWNCTQSYSWPYRVFKKYFQELNLLYWSRLGAKKYIYHSMKQIGCTMDMDPNEILAISTNQYNFKDLRGWAKGFNLFQVWTRLNLVMSLNSILETYISTVVSLAIESDPGVLIDSSHKVDGTLFLKKHGGFSRSNYESQINATIKGEWTSRHSSFSSLFNSDFPVMAEHIEILEELRQKRNSVGHAYGRDISKSRDYLVSDILPMNGIAEDRIMKFFDAVSKVALEIDKVLLTNHIGEYQVILAYHRFYTKYKPIGFTNDKAYAFRKYYGKYYTNNNIDRQFCIGLVKHYESTK